LPAAAGTIIDAIIKGVEKLKKKWKEEAEPVERSNRDQILTEVQKMWDARTRL
jgi:hypothetical protein